jgi:hypothetical protein
MRCVTPDLPVISDDQMREALPTAREYTVVILRHGPDYGRPDADAIIWEHGRRNFALRAAGLLSIVCPIRDDGDVSGVGVFAADPATVERIMADDPGVKGGVFTFEIHAARSFPGDCLPVPTEAGRAAPPA